jgi:hypothetical protein
VRGQGPPVFGKCAANCFSLGGPLSHARHHFSCPTCPIDYHRAALHSHLGPTPAQPPPSLCCSNEKVMTRRYDPEQVTHPLDVAHSAALVGGATGMYSSIVASPLRRHWLGGNGFLHGTTPLFLLSSHEVVEPFHCSNPAPLRHQLLSRGLPV